MNELIMSRELTEIEQDVWDLIPSGRKNRVSRRILSQRVGLSLRDLRATVAELRKKGYAVMSTSNTEFSGYWVPTAEELTRDIARYLQETSSRITEISLSTRWTSETKIKEGQDD